MYTYRHVDMYTYICVIKLYASRRGSTSNIDVCSWERQRPSHNGPIMCYHYEEPCTKNEERLKKNVLGLFTTQHNPKIHN